MTNLQAALIAATIYLANDPGADAAKIERLALHWHEWLGTQDGTRDIEVAARRLRERENR